MFAFLLIAGTVLGVMISALGHPMIYGAVFKKPVKSDDHADILSI